MPPPGRMQERAAPRTRGEIAREAKGLAMALKEMLKRKDPWDQEINFQRLNLRQQYLSLIFRRPHSTSSTSSKPHTPTHAVDSLNLLWLDTSHALIQLYRHKLNALDQATQAAAQASNKPKRPNPAQGQTGPVARRRLVHSFRQFLSEEEKFWRDQLVRIVQTYRLERAESALRALGITVPPGLWDADEAVLPSHTGTGEATYSSSGDGGNQARTAEDLVRHEGILLCHKALICYGDLARYRELAGDFPPGMGNSKGHSKGKDRRREGEKKTTTTQVALAAAEGEGSAAASGAAGAVGKKERCWNRAAECYHQARLLAPENGNPSNQLAVISAYAGDALSSSYHYYRALCVKQPFTTAKGNLELTYSKAVLRWQRAPDYRLYCERKLDGASDAGSAIVEPTGKDVSVFKTDFVALHGLFYLRKIAPAWQDLNLLVTDAFEALVATRSLPSEIIVKVVVTGLCSLWVSRMRLGEVRKTKTEPTDEQLMQQPAVEMAILTHVLDITRILLTIAYTETKDVAPSQHTSNDLTSTEDGGSGHTSNLVIAENITAVLRRTLPALRIAIKWVVADLDYIRRSTRHALVAPPSADPNASSQVYLFPELVAAVNSFWDAYADFANVFSVVFPLQDLPAGDGVLNLEEDVDTLGFLPLRRGPDLSASINTGAPVPTGDRPLAMALPTPQVHPNEEQLARVADLLGMTNLVSGVEASPLKKIDKRFVIDAVALEHGVTMDVSALDALPLPPFNLGEYQQDDGEVGDQSTDDDPVDLAMRAATGTGMDVIDFDDFDDEEDLDQYSFRRQSNPGVRPVGSRPTSVQVPGQNVSATPPPQAQPSPRRAEIEEQRRPSLLPHHLPPAPPRSLQPLQAHSTTAADLLSAVMSGNPSVSAPPSSFSTYGSGNIWAPVPASVSSSNAIFAANAGSSHYGQQLSHVAPGPPLQQHAYSSPSIWNNEPAPPAAAYGMPAAARYVQSTSAQNLQQQQYPPQQAQAYAPGQPYQHTPSYGLGQASGSAYD